MAAEYPQAKAGAVAPKISQLRAFGHSYVNPNGTGQIGNQANRWTTKLAALLGATETNKGQSGACITADRFADSGKPWPITGGWQDCKRDNMNTHTSGNHWLCLRQLVTMMWGLNDLSMLQGSTSTQGRIFKDALRLCIASVRGYWFNHDDASIAYTNGTWTSFAQTTGSEGKHYSPSAAPKATVTIPADYPGGQAYFAHTAAQAPGNGTATATYLKNGVQVARNDYSANLTTAPEDEGTGTVTVFTVSAGDVIEIDFSNVTGASGANLMGYWLDCQFPPLVVLVKQPKPFVYTNYDTSQGSTWPHTIGDADVDALNGWLDALAAEFSDGAVVATEVPNIPKAANWYKANDVHPLEQGHARIAEVVYQAIVEAGTADMFLMGASS